MQKASIRQRIIKKLELKKKNKLCGEDQGRCTNLQSKLIIPRMILLFELNFLLADHLFEHAWKYHFTVILLIIIKLFIEVPIVH